MTIFAIIDITPAGAYCNAISAASKSDRKAENRQPAERGESLPVRALKSLASLVVEQRRKMATVETHAPIDGKTA